MVRYKTLFLNDINANTDKKLIEKNIIMKLKSGYLGMYNVAVLKNKDGNPYYLFKDIDGTSVNNFGYEDLEQLNEHIPIVEGISAFLQIEGLENPIPISNFEMNTK